MASKEDAYSRFRMPTIVTGVLSFVYIFASGVLFLQAEASPAGSWLSLIIGQELSVWASLFAYFAITWLGLVIVVANLVLDIKLLFGRNASETDNMVGLFFGVPSGTALGLVAYLYLYALLAIIS